MRIIVEMALENAQRPSLALDCLLKSTLYYYLCRFCHGDLCSKCTTRPDRVVTFKLVFKWKHKWRSLFGKEEKKRRIGMQSFVRSSDSQSGIPLTHWIRDAALGGPETFFENILLNAYLLICDDSFSIKIRGSQ